MSKTFKSVTDNESELDVRANDCGVFIAFSRAGQILQASTFAPSDAAELMLAIGDTLPVTDMVREGSYEHFLGNAIHYLAKAVKAQESEAAEAEAQAKLEAEALDLFNAGVVEGEFQSGPYDSFAQIHDYAKPKWLAVARRAREINKEENNA
ncbi:hypothetical protein [Glutamicibacter mishrai]|uniref:hypothetical protein n=1 Tax=Glutamicibacter mishrai TaxID=1775880 RepID=UPI003F78FDFA